MTGSSRGRSLSASATTELFSFQGEHVPSSTRRDLMRSLFCQVHVLKGVGVLRKGSMNSVFSKKFVVKLCWNKTPNTSQRDGSMGKL
jgi:hypothetical protein